jgi:hypothetical protein
MKIAGCGNEIFGFISYQFYKGIVSAVRRQLNHTYFSLCKCEFVQEALAQIHMSYSPLTIEELVKGKYWEKLSGEMRNEPQGQRGTWADFK